MVYRPDIDNDQCFVLMPFSEPFFGYYEQIIRPAAGAAGLKAVQAGEICTRAIIRDIWDSIWKARVVIADVTGKNPNVNYELGICHTLGIPTVLIAKDLADIPFDYRHRRCIIYDTDLAGWDVELKEKLTRTLVAAKSDPTEDELPWPYDTLPSAPTENVVGGRAPSRVLTADDALRSILKGATMVQEVLATAYGPDGMCVSTSGGEDQESISRSGHRIAARVYSDDPFERKGIDFLTRVATRMHDEIGDGVKTAVLLAHAMLKTSCQGLESGEHPNQVLRGIRQGVNQARDSLTAGSRKTGASHSIAIARTASGSSELAQMTIEALERAGERGAVLVEPNMGAGTIVDECDGLGFEGGYLSPYFVTNAKEMRCELWGCYVLVMDCALTRLEGIVPLLDRIAHSKKPLLIVAEDVGGEALAALVVNKLRNVISVAATRPTVGENKKRAIFQDVADLTGTEVCAEREEERLKTATLDRLGRSYAVVLTKTETIISAPSWTDRKSRQRTDGGQQSGSTPKNRQRIVRIGIGGQSFDEGVDRRHGIESSLKSVKHGRQGGWVVGGGVAAYRTARELARQRANNSGIACGVRAVAHALQEPITRLIANSGQSPEEQLDKIVASRRKGVGYNVANGKIETLTDAGIVDPLANILQSLQIAESEITSILRIGAWHIDPSNAQDVGPVSLDQSGTTKPAGPNDAHS